MQRLKPYYNLISETLVTGKAPCPECGSDQVINQLWCESCHGWMPDDYVYKFKCAQCETSLDDK